MRSKERSATVQRFERKVNVVLISKTVDLNNQRSIYQTVNTFKK